MLTLNPRFWNLVVIFHTCIQGRNIFPLNPWSCSMYELSLNLTSNNRAKERDDYKLVSQELLKLIYRVWDLQLALYKKSLMLWSNALVRPKQWRLEQLPVGSALRGWTMTQALTAAGGWADSLYNSQTPARSTNGSWVINNSI